MGLMIRGLPSLARLALGPSRLGSRSWATLTYCNFSSAPPSPPSGASVHQLAGRSTRRCKCKIQLTIFNLINYNQRMTTMGAWLTSFTKIRNTLSILFQKGTICGSLLFTLLDSDCVHLYVNNLIQLHK
jgi:hypothetical protein